MPQLSLYITDENLATLKTRAKESGVSMSKYANQLIERDERNAGWPLGFWDLYGALGDDFAAPDDPPPSDDAQFEALFA